jgi:hydrogenase 3 maturation protease
MYRGIWHMHKISYNEFLDALKNRAKGRVVIVGIGNELRGDDGFGPYVIESLQGKINAKLLNCGTALENYYNPIVKERPDAIILLDAVNFNGPYGEIGFFKKDDILKVGFSTHNISPKVFIELLESSIDADITMVGVKPKSTAFGDDLSAEVREAADMLKDFFIELLPTKGA